MNNTTQGAEAEALYVANHELSKEEVLLIRTQIKNLYRRGYVIDCIIHLDKAGTIIVFVK